MYGATMTLALLALAIASYIAFWLEGCLVRATEKSMPLYFFLLTHANYLQVNTKSYGLRKGGHIGMALKQKETR